MAVELKQLWAGGTEADKTTIKARVDLGAVESVENNYKVYTIQYKWDVEPGKLKIWCNNEIVSEADASENYPYYYNLLIGGDEDNLIGYMPEVLIIKTGWNSVLDSEIIAYNKWLADK